MRRILALSFGWALLLSASLAAQEPQAIPSPQGHVTDLVGVLSAPDRAEIDRILREYEDQHGSQIVVLIVDTTAPEVIEDYSMRVAERWKVGRKKVDDGVIFTVAIKDRKARIEVGYGLEGALPDARAKQILSDQVFPAFRKQDYAGGIRGGVDGILAALAGESLPPPGKVQPEGFWQRESFGVSRTVLVVVMLALVGLLVRLVLDGIFGVLIGHGLSASGTGALSGLFALVAAGEPSGVAAIYGVGMFLFVLLFGPWVFQLLSVFSGSGSGGGGGGFSGGGGSFGGGGASGDW